MKTIAEIMEAARAAALSGGRKRIAVAAAQEHSALEAAVDAWKHGLADPILVGDLGAMDAIAAELGLDLSPFQRIEEKEVARAAAKAVSLVKAALNKETGINAGRLVSHVAVMELPTYHKLLIVTDAAINIAPDIPAKLDIIANAAEAAHAIGIPNPKVALLAAVEKVNWEKMPCTAEAAIITQMNRRGQVRGCLVDGPLALDNAVSAESAKIKKIDSEVAGDADILVVPDLEAGNVLYKSLVDLGRAKCAAVVMGAAAPVVLTSRADTAATKLASIALAALAS